MTGLFKKEDLLAVVIYPLVVVLMEAFWIYPWVVWLGRLLPSFDQMRPPVSILSAIIVLSVSLAVTRIFHKREWRLGYIRAAIIGGGIVVMFLVLRIEYGSGYGLFDGGWGVYFVRMVGASFEQPNPLVAAMPVIICLWWRGILLGRATVYFENIYRSFIIGIAGLILLIVVWLIMPDNGGYEDPLSSISLYALSFFLFGLTALAIRNIYLMRTRMAEKESRTSIWRSLPLTLAVIGGIVIAGLLVATLFSPEFLNTIAAGFKALGSLLRKALYYIIFPLQYVVAAIFRVMRWLVNLIRKPEEQEAQEFGASPIDEIERESGEMPQIISTILETLVVAALVAAAIFILAKAIRRIKSRGSDDEFEETHESLWSKDTLKDDLRRLLKTIGQKFRRASIPASVFYDDETGDLNIREIYKRLLWEAGGFGIIRRKYETPSEYAGRLEEYLTDGKGQLYRITDLYSEVRYGEIELEEEEIHAANDLWVRLRGNIRRIGEPDE